ncbi:Hypothetical predicted protein [Pelobates cultripes]|uniref:Uncharacterized protein n=1 Tax=Pelobates cultripes TaxID=61616 RepID=A0AAD1S2Y6_PELCU|nr:Hypothetical predicted protein [Pelobates cultripes]
MCSGAQTRLKLDSIAAVKVSVDPSTLALSINAQINLSCKEKKGIILDLNIQAGNLITEIVDGGLSLKLNKAVVIKATLNGKSITILESLVSPLVNIIIKGVTSTVDSALDLIVGVASETLSQVSYIVGNIGGVLTKFSLISVSHVDELLYCEYDFIEEGAEKSFDFGSYPPTPPSPGHWSSYCVTEQTLTWMVLNVLGSRTISIEASQFAPLFTEPLSSYLDLTFSIATGQCTILETGVKVQLGVDVQGVCPIFGHVLTATVNLEVDASLSINYGIGLKLNAVSIVKISLDYITDKCSCDTAHSLIENIIDINVRNYLDLSASCDMKQILPEPTPVSTNQYYKDHREQYTPEVTCHSGYANVQHPDIHY